MSKTKKTKNSKDDKKFVVIGSIAVAAIGVIGTIIAAYIGFLGTRIQVERPIHATQTAEHLSNAQSITTPVPDNAISIEAIDITSNDVNMSSLVEINSNWSPCGPRLLPSYIDLEDNLDEAQRQINEALSASEMGLWELGPYINQGDFFLRLEIKNVSNNPEWLRLSNQVNFIVSTIREIPIEMNFVEFSECGGVGYFKEFPPSDLLANVDEYKIGLTYPDADYFTLQPGEFEIFDFSIFCKDPGLYEIAIEIPVSHDNQDGTI
ncbi:MAG: hypothetical protein H8D34_23590, partial [Chloroflexi bacterium]|nr:hypothetical protein [Chloroflexota bacterium]